MAPVRSPRLLYKIAGVTIDRDGAGTGVAEPVIVKMKESHGRLLGLSPIDSNDPIFYGTFATGPNAGKTYLRNLGGFREASYRLVARNGFSVTEIFFDASNNRVERLVKKKSVDIGFPKGHSANEIVSWLRGLPVADEIDAVIMPSGRRFAFHAAGI